MFKSLLLIFSLVGSSHLFATGTAKVEISSGAEATSNPAIAYLPMIYEGGGGSETDPVNVYIPYSPDITTPTPLDDFVTLSNSVLIPRYNSPVALKVNLTFRTTLKVTNPDTTKRYLYVAVKDSVSGLYEVVKKIGTFFDTNSVSSELTTLDYQTEICDLIDIPQCTTNINDLGDEPTVLIYYFLSTSVITPTTVISPTTSTDGVFYKFNISSKVPDGSIIFTSLRPGDGRAVATFDGLAVTNMTKIYKILIFKRTNNTEKRIGVLSGGTDNVSLIYKSLDPLPSEPSGSFTITDLENSVTVDITLALENKYQFVSKIPLSLNVTPLKIEALLESQACFLLTAGFGEEHWVIDYFKEIRDHFLAKFSAGRWFIGAYYELAPKYALQIYHSEALRLIIRTMAYVAYSLIHYYYIYLTIFGFLAYLLLRRRHGRRIKIAGAQLSRESSSS
jgi:hypothetical protein